MQTLPAEQWPLRQRQQLPLCPWSIGAEETGGSLAWRTDDEDDEYSLQQLQDISMQVFPGGRKMQIWWPLLLCSWRSRAQKTI